MKQFVFGLGFALFLWSPAQADEYDDYRKCLLRVSEEVHESKIAFQNSLADLIIDDNPSLGALAALNRDLQIALAESRRIKLDYVIVEDLPRLVSASGLIRFVNFEWSRTDEALLQNDNKDYSALIDQINLLGEENNSNPAWPELRAKFIELQDTKEFQKVLNTFNSNTEKAEKRLEGC